MTLQKAHHLFVYGTLCDSNTRKAVFGKYLHGSPDRLTGYIKKEAVIMNRYPDLEKVADSPCVVHGLVLQVDESLLLKADQYETKAYIRKVVTLESGTRAWVYFGNKSTG